MLIQFFYLWDSDISFLGHQLLGLFQISRLSFLFHLAVHSVYYHENPLHFPPFVLFPELTDVYALGFQQKCIDKHCFSFKQHQSVCSKHYFLLQEVFFEYYSLKEKILEDCVLSIRSHRKLNIKLLRLYMFVWAWISLHNPEWCCFRSLLCSISFRISIWPCSAEDKDINMPSLSEVRRNSVCCCCLLFIPHNICYLFANFYFQI